MNLIVFFTITYCFDELLLHYLSQFEIGLNFLLYLFRNIIFMFCVFSLINLFIKKNCFFYTHYIYSNCFYVKYMYK